MMKLLPRTQLAVVIAALIGTSTITLLLTPTLRGLAEQVRTYGADGRDGRDGRNGHEGRDGRSQSVWVDGTPIQIEVGGESGQDGEVGDRGQRPTCPAQPRRVRYDLQAPDGGDGGDGGTGGAGGRGGDISLYYTDLAQLRQVSVNANGGRGGRGGYGGRGTAGCRCDDRRWHVQVCHDGNCETEHYRCRDGEPGRDGRDGRQGESGTLGQLWLINRAEPLPAEQPHINQLLNTWLRQPLSLSRHLWETRSGAGGLLAAGSIVNDTYYEYRERLATQVQLDWQAERSPTQFLNFSADVTLLETGNVQLDFSEAVWVDSRAETTDGITTVTIHRIARAANVSNLAWGSQTGSGADFAVTVIDLGRESAYVDTEFELTYRTTDDNPRNVLRGRYSEQFSGVLPPNLVTQDQNRFVLQLGQLPIPARSLRPGTRGQIELRIVRSLGSHSADQTLEWEGQLIPRLPTAMSP
ncbi:hypothetical protein [Halomicronema sp. CCY15110]|uniref:hypothetical protein n=1 Tax=Halomicronema sp. CCY15110 TaxID=2767773 RepID=UPI001952442B|nr:hypothetical protein [Halomicronema sp. CCY15110]